MDAQQHGHISVAPHETEPQDPVSDTQDHSLHSSSNPAQIVPPGIVNHHVRNNESFSRSRSSTGALLDTSNVMTSADDTWPSSHHLESTIHHNLDDFNAAFEDNPTSSHFEADLAEHDRKEALDELEGWAEQNEDGSKAPFGADPLLDSAAPVDALKQWQEHAEAALAESSLLGNAPTGVHEADQDHVHERGTKNPNETTDMFGTAEEEEDDWSKALKGSDEVMPQESTISDDAKAMTSDFKEGQEPETIQELQEPLMDVKDAAPIAAPAEDIDFGEALKSVSEDLKEAHDVANEPQAIFGETQEADDEWLKPSKEPGQNLDDSWAKAMGDSGDPKADGSWAAAFHDGFDEDGFLDEDGLLEDEALAPQSPPTPPAPSKTSAYTPSQSQPYTPPAPQLQSSTAPQNTMPSPFAPAPAVQSQQPSKGQPTGMKFFEDLPITQPSRSRKSKQQVVQPPGAPPPQPLQPPTQTVTPPQQPPMPTSQPLYNQLQPPQKLDLFPPQPTHSPDPVAYTQRAVPQQSSLQPQPAPNSRYSPAPAASTSPSSRYASAPPPTGPPSSSRYSPAPSQPNNVSMQPPSYSPAQQPPSQSAPPAARPLQAAPPPPPPAAQRQPSSRYSPAPSQPSPPSNTSVTTPPSSSDSPADSSGPPPPAGPPPSFASHRFAPRTSSPLAQPDARPQLDRSTTAPGPPSHTSPEPSPTQAPPTASQGGPPMGPPRSQRPKFEPPRRPRTQSPERQASKNPPSMILADRRTSLQETVTAAPVQPPATAHGPSAQPNVPFQTQGPSTSDDLDYLPPSDAQQAQDPLHRWKGCPSLHWSSGSLMVTHFPKHDLRFGGGRSAPACKCSPGELKVSRIKEQMPVDESLTSFPGPLKSKSKKKDLLTWLSNRIEVLQRDFTAAHMPSMDPRVSERLLLWKILRTFIEHDGVLAGNPATDMAVKQILTPPLEEPVSGNHTRSASSVTVLGQSEGANPFAVAEIRRLLMDGDREKAIWHAVDNKFWGHAMLISSTTEGTHWKQVAQEFVRSEVRSSSSDRKSLAALYSIMAQNWDESVDELVPASARAGFQMMSTADAARQSSNALEGLNKWQETLSLVIGNRSPQDEFGLLALGKLLRDYGRVEAAHICFMFAPSLVRFGGVDDHEANVTLLGADVLRDAGQDLDAILLTEVYEFGLSLRPSAGSHFIPHLQAYKLHHAHILADDGYRSEASQYCDSIGTAIKSTTRPSPYYHPGLITRLEDLNQRLSQTPKDSSSWISKPTVGKASASMWAKFNSFVAGEDDAASNGSGPHSENEAGPFAKLPGGTPTISRNTSHADLTSFTPMNAPPIPPAGSSRYAPSYPGPSDVPKGVPTNPYQPSVHQPSMPNSAPQDIPKPTQPYNSPPGRSSSFGASQVSGFNPYQPPNHLGISDTASQASSSYDPPILQHPGLTGEHSFGSPSTTFSDRGTSSHGIPHEDMPAIEEEVAPYQENGYAPTANGFEATGGYAPPTVDTGYVPYEPEPDSPEAKPKKKSFMDDDDDDGIAAHASTLKNSGASKARGPDDNARKTMEADTERDRQATEQKKSGWFGSWFAKKDPNAPVVHKAKLGEENSFYYDPDLKRWVNKKGSDPSQDSASSTPPPPKAKPTPPTSAPQPGSGLAPPSRTATPAHSDASGGSGEGQSSMPPLMGAGPPSNPPSRPATSLSNASSIDDLLAAGPRRGGGAKRGKKRQVVDVMSQ